MQSEDYQNIAVGPKYRYSPKLAQIIEKKWQNFWRENQTFSVSNPVGDLAGVSGPLKEKKKYILDMFPYPSGAGLHVGHTLGFVATDIYARYCRMQQTSVLYTMGFDAFGLPAEQYAIETGTHPKLTTQKNINNYLQQIAGLGLSHDLNRRLATTEEDFYKWTQWIFLRIFEAWFDEEQNKARPISELVQEFASGKRATPDGKSWSELSKPAQNELINSYRLVYQANSLVNWCPGLGTVLANEEVTVDGKSERGNFPVFRKHLKQWMMRITKYADRLDADLQDLDWPETIKAMQHNWIGKSVGANIDFWVESHKITVFTTRADTIYGVTYLALSPENELLDGLVGEEWPAAIPEIWKAGAATPQAAVENFRSQMAAKSDVERMEAREKTGVFIGKYAKHPLTGKAIPIFVTNYVLPGYGTEAVMGVPAHDARDQEFAEKYQLPEVRVVDEQEILINSEKYSGLTSTVAKKQIIADLTLNKQGKAVTQYKLKDWLFARQRYWGEPFPIIFDSNNQPLAIPDSELPVTLPEMVDYSPHTFDPNDRDSEPQPPLAKATDWINLELDLGDGLKAYKRDANVMPQWAGSSWYLLRYIDPHNSEVFCDPANEAYWIGPNKNSPTGGADLYIGGVEHAVLHLLYARFWHKVLYDLGYVSSSEPFHKLFNQGYIQGHAYLDKRGVYVPAAEVKEEDGKYFYQGQEVVQEFGKIGKSLKNSITPDEVFTEYGADTLRIYEIAMGPLDASRAWSTKDIVGAQRFLQRVWRLVIDEETGDLGLTEIEVLEETTKLLHKTIQEVKQFYEGLKFNTAIAKLIELTNHFTKHYPQGINQELAEPLILMLSPLAPHISEELWSKLHPTADSIAYVDFPEYEEKYLTADTIDLPVQVQGKFKAKVTIPIDADEAAAKQIILADEQIATWVTTEPKRIIYVPGRMMNIIL